MFLQPPMTSAGRIRKLWGEFQPWAAAQRKIYERRRDEITKVQDAKWKAAPLKTRAKQDEHEIQKTRLLREALDDCVEKVRAEWDSRLGRNNLDHSDWGVMEPQELESVEDVLGDDEPSKPAVQNVVAQPSLHQVVPAPIPAPPLTSTARTVNLSTSTASSYTLVNPNEFSTDDEHYDAMGRFITPSATDESEDESRPVPITRFDGWGIDTQAGAGASWGVSAQTSASTQSPHHSPQNGSPEHLSSSSSNKLVYFTNHPAMSRPSINEAPHKRPPDKDSKGKARVRGPTYIGPHLSSPEDTSESEEDFELFKMQTRIAKVYEFHQEAAALDAELAIVLHNERSSKKAIWKEYAAERVAEHEKRVLKLQAEKEDERKEIVNAERRKRREEIEQRQRNGDPARRVTNAPQGSLHPEERQHAFKKSQTVRLGADRKTFILVPEDDSEADGNETWNTSQVEPSASELRIPVLGQNDTLRARRQSVVGRGTPSGWRTKQTTSTPTTSLSHQWLGDPHPPTAPSPDISKVPEWMEATFSGTPLDYSSSSYDSESDLMVPGGFPNSTSTPVPPIPSGWGPKKSVPATTPATSLLRQVLSDPIANSTPVTGNAKKNTSPPTAAPTPPKAAPPAPEPKPAHISAAPIKKNAKKGRLTATSAAIAAAQKKEEEESPTTPMLTAKPNPPSMAKDILQRGLGYPHTDDELSSTPRPQLFAKRGSILDYSSDVASTPRAMTRRLGGENSASSGLASSWTLEAQEEETPWQRMQKAKANGQAPAQVQRAAVQEEQETPWQRMQKAQAQRARGEEEETPWQRMQKAQAQAQAQSQQEEETPWQRMQRMQMQGQVQQTKPSPAISQEEAWALEMTMSGMEDEGGSMWEQKMKAQTAVPQRSTPASVIARGAATAAPEESLWGQVVMKNQMAAMTAQQQQQQQSQPEETLWERQMRLRAQGTLPNTASSNLAKSALDQSARMPSVAGWGGPMDFEPPTSRHAQQQPSTHAPPDQFWTPNGSASSHPQMWNPNAQQKPQQSSGSYQFDGQPARRPSGTESMGYEYNGMLDDHDHRAWVSGVMTKRKGKATASKVMIEEVPDEEGPSLHKGPALPYNSRHLLDIVEPKPSVPSTMFSNIIQFGEEEDEEEYEYYPGMSSTVPTPSTAPTSPPGEIPSLDDEELLEQMKNGNWGSLIEGSGSLTHDVLSKPQAPRWPPEPSAKKKAPGSQMVDSAKLFSALESMEPAPASSPKASPPTKASTPPKAAPAAMTPSAAPPPAAKSAPAVVEKPEPVGKPSNQPKGKGKGKGKGRK